MEMKWIEASPFDHKRMLGSSHYLSERERAWYERHEPWFREQVERGTTRWADEPAYVVNRALSWLLENAREAEPRWEDLNVREVLLELMPLGGIPMEFGARDLLKGLKEFVTWMAQHKKICPRAACRINAEVDACQKAFLGIFGDRESVVEIKRVQQHLQEAEDPGEVWLWCLHCERFFKAKHLRADRCGNRQGCPFRDCSAAGLDLDIFYWDTWRNWNDPGWPTSEDQLRHGRRAS